MYNYPYENNDSPVRRVLSDYGSVKGISYQTWVGLAGVHTGTRVRMVCSSPIPRVPYDCWGTLQDLVQGPAGDLQCLQGGGPRSR